MGRYDWNSDPDEIGMSGGLFGRLFPEAYAEAESLGDAQSQPSAGDGGIASPFSPSIPAAFGVWPSASPFTQLGQGPVPPVYSPPASDPPAPVLTAKVQANQPAPVDADGVVQAGYRLGIPVPAIPTPPTPLLPPLPTDSGMVALSRLGVSTLSGVVAQANSAK